MGFPGPVYPVNPKLDELLGLKAYARLEDIPGPVDFVISAVPAGATFDLVEGAKAKGTKLIHFFTARFSETGRADAAELEQELRRRTQEAGIRVIGPNCMGLFYPKQRITFDPDILDGPGQHRLSQPERQPRLPRRRQRQGPRPALQQDRQLRQRPRSERGGLSLSLRPGPRHRYHRRLHRGPARRQALLRGSPLCRREEAGSRAQGRSDGCRACGRGIAYGVAGERADGMEGCRPTGGSAGSGQS